MECPYDNIKVNYETWDHFETKNLETHTEIQSKIQKTNDKLKEYQCYEVIYDNCIFPIYRSNKINIKKNESRNNSFKNEYISNSSFGSHSSNGTTSECTSNISDNDSDVQSWSFDRLNYETIDERIKSWYENKNIINKPNYNNEKQNTNTIDINKKMYQYFI